MNMAVSPIPKNLDKDSPEVAGFMQKRRNPGPTDALRALHGQLETALEHPDKRPSTVGAPSTIPEPISPAQAVVPEIQAEPLRQPAPPHLAVLEDEVGAQMPEPTARAEAPKKAEPAKLKFIERTLSLEEGQMKQIKRFANLDGLRMDTNVPVSDIIRNLLAFAIAHVDPDKGEVIPTPDGRGLHLPAKKG